MGDRPFGLPPMDLPGPLQKPNCSGNRCLSIALINAYFRALSIFVDMTRSVGKAIDFFRWGIT
jgi:hypothetical protein